ncbi:hypothetical protein [Xenorhabdus bovienii]|uniref:hypothetical protein n=1 Tax=Xenorhabdus bovienii TaxID=40576 RepID=UPI00237CFBA4|nr:hypothetical protein [Xenorhabdus bovienii]MDE1480968.1 hypothetical protein [Xenorhabdus bovienii]MDE9429192.1 hypothetical protein [Xenorhabdus bovienii]MDE9486826.1 hypothetical protein [Xenorhabdus bovienii]
MSFYDLYAFEGLHIREAKNIIELSLGTKLDERESTFQGGEYYISGNKKSENFILKKNIDPFDGEPVEMDHPEYKIIFYINNTDRPNCLKCLLLDTKKFILLRTEEILD